MPEAAEPEQALTCFYPPSFLHLIRHLMTLGRALVPFRRWSSVAGAGWQAPAGSQAASAAAAAAALPAVRLLADRTFVSRVYQAQGRLLVAAMLLAQGRAPSPAAEDLVSSPLRQRSHLLALPPPLCPQQIDSSTGT